MTSHRVPTKTAVRKAADIYLTTENLSWYEVPEILHRQYGYPIYRSESLRRKAKDMKLIPVYYCPYCKKAQTSKLFGQVCDPCSKKGRKANLGVRKITREPLTKGELKSLKHLQDNWLCKPLR